LINGNRKMAFAIISSLTSYLKSITILNLYLGAFLAALIETIFPPIPSEIVMPLAGYLASSGNYGYPGMFLVIISATIGATIGAFIIYYVSKKLGRFLILKYGRYFFVSEEKLSAAERWFKKYGSSAVFFGRMAPGVRELISIPAGFSNMNFNKFAVYTFLGTLLWTSFLVSLGFFFGVYIEKWNLSGIFDKIAILLILVIIAYIIFKYLIKKFRRK